MTPAGAGASRHAQTAWLSRDPGLLPAAASFWQDAGKVRQATELAGKMVPKAAGPARSWERSGSNSEPFPPRRRPGVLFQRSAKDRAWFPAHDRACGSASAFRPRPCASAGRRGPSFQAAFTAARAGAAVAVRAIDRFKPAISRAMPRPRPGGDSAGASAAAPSGRCPGQAPAGPRAGHAARGGPGAACGSSRPLDQGLPCRRGRDPWRAPALTIPPRRTSPLDCSDSVRPGQGHQPTRIAEAADVADLCQDGGGDNECGTAHGLHRLRPGSGPAICPAGFLRRIRDPTGVSSPARGAASPA